jgi:hypothetical protein
METPPKPSALFHTGGALMEVTPLGEGGVKIADVAALLEKILHLLMEDPLTSSAGARAVFHPPWCS